ncbi:MAG: hypothetical protein KZQ71_01855 [Candidatus Thiodiazotropha sp. (ex Lucinoma aequizonata)]|nr:hypothetical protein [Candidatus Thiodiazotropha sp. (ex Lucinoma aequizonata)]
MITDGEAAIESRDLSAVLEMVDPRYLDKQQHDYHQLRVLLPGCFLRYRSIHITQFRVISAIQLRSD